MLKVAILDDYAGFALQAADWSLISGIAEITVFGRHLSQAEAADVLAPFDVVCTMRERMAFPRSLFQKLPRLKLLTIIGMSLANLDMDAATDHAVLVVHPDFSRPAFGKAVNATPELAWGLLLATVRHIAFEDRSLRAGSWQRTMGVMLAGRTLGLLGLGRIGTRMAAYGHAFGMNVIAWSQNLSVETAAAVGVTRVEKDALFRRADVVSLHVKLSERTRTIVGAAELSLMKPDAYLINTSRGPLVDEAALVSTLREGRLAGAGIDVFDEEPLAADHPFRRMDTVTITPHLGYVTQETMRAMYEDVPEAIAAFANGAPIRMINGTAKGIREQG